MAQDSLLHRHPTTCRIEVAEVWQADEQPDVRIAGADDVRGGFHHLPPVTLAAEHRIGQHAAQAVCPVDLTRMREVLPHHPGVADQHTRVYDRDVEGVIPCRLNPMPQAILTREVFRPDQAVERQNLTPEVVWQLIVTKRHDTGHRSRLSSVTTTPRGASQCST